MINFISNPNELWHSGGLVTDFLYVIMGGWIWSPSIALLALTPEHICARKHTHTHCALARDWSQCTYLKTNDRCDERVSEE